METGDATMQSIPRHAFPKAMDEWCEAVNAADNLWGKLEKMIDRSEEVLSSLQP